MKELIALKESKENFQELLERFNAFSGIESMHNYTTIYAPFIQGFITQVEELENSNKNVLDCILKFDQDLSLKCNKSAF